MTIAEIQNKIEQMSTGSKTHFIRYLVRIGMFYTREEAFEKFTQYLRCKPNSASFINRQKISDAFDEWCYRYGARRKSANKEDVILDFNERLEFYWKYRWNGK